MIWGHELAPVSWLSQVHKATLRVFTYALLQCYFFHWASDSPPAMRDLPLDFPTLFPPPSAQAASKQGPPVSPHTGLLQLVMDLIVGAHPHDSTLRESSREAQSGRRLLGTQRKRCRDPRCSPRGNPACRGTFGGRRKAVRDRLALQGGTGDFP